MLDQFDSGAAGGERQGAAEQPVVDLVVARAQHRGGDAGLQMRLAAARLHRRQPFEIEPEPFLEPVGMLQLRRVVAVERDDDGALVAIVDRHAGGVFQLARKIGPQALAFEGERQ